MVSSAKKAYHCCFWRVSIYLSGAAAIELGLDPSLDPHQVNENIVRNGTIGVLDLQGASDDTPNLLLYVGQFFSKVTWKTVSS